MTARWILLYVVANHALTSVIVLLTLILRIYRLIIELSFHIYILTRLDYSSWTFWLDSILISGQGSIRVPDSTRQAIEYDVKRAKYRKIFRFFAFALPFCITFLIESHEGEHGGYLVGSHGGETWRLFGRESWRGAMKGSHGRELW